MLTFNKEKLGGIFDWVIFIPVLMICFLYSLEGSHFAEWHIQPPFLNFPIFVGEILLGFCLVFLTAKWIWVAPPNLTSGQMLLIGLYLFYVLARAFSGYVHYGPYAFRNAALYYYPLFALIGYYIYRKDFFSQTMVMLFLLVIISTQLIRGGDYFGYFSFIYFMLYLVLALKLEKKRLRYLALLCALFIFPLQNLFNDGRTHVVSMVLAFFYLFFVLVFRRWKIKKYSRPIVVTLLIGTILLCLLIFGNHAAVKSLMPSMKIFEEYKKHKDYIDREKNNFKQKEIAVSLYSKNIKVNTQEHRVYIVSAYEPSLERTIEEFYKKIDDPSGEVSLREEESEVVSQFYEGIKVKLQDHKEAMKIRAMETMRDWVPHEQIPGRFEEVNKEFGEDIKAEVEQAEKKVNAAKISKDRKDMVRKRIEKIADGAVDVLNTQKGIFVNSTAFGADRDMVTNYMTTLFRFFVWHDMFEEVVGERLPLGVNWGKPQRSISIEILNVADGEWGRDGWIAPHNSFFHVLYRSGIVGLGLILGFFSLLGRMIRDVLKRNDLALHLLLTVLIYWLVVANFSVFLELPFHAIPFWALFGFILAYGHTHTSIYDQKL